MASGNYFFDHTDLSLGGPMRLGFARSYDSGLNDTQRMLGYGWTHNYDIYIGSISHGDPVLGRRQPIDAASFISALYVILDLVNTQNNIQGWMSAALASKWAVDQTVNNALVVHKGKKIMEFIQLANGTYAAPPGSTLSLAANSNGTYSLLGRFGDSTEFNTNMQISQSADADGNTITFTYTGNNLTTIQDNFNHSLTLQYDGSNRVNSVLDSAGRSVSYGYDGNNNLTSFTDADGKVWGYGY